MIDYQPLDRRAFYFTDEDWREAAIQARKEFDDRSAPWRHLAGQVIACSMPTAIIYRDGTIELGLREPWAQEILDKCHRECEAIANDMRRRLETP